MINLDYFMNCALASLCEGKDFMGASGGASILLKMFCLGGLFFAGWNNMLQ
jgi:hypothetical protein